MKVLNFGSLNYDYVYSVPHIARPGETLGATDLNTFCGGKGLNQSVALSRAGMEVYHAGFVGPDGNELIQACNKNAVDTRYVLSVFEKTGNSVIQVGADGQNSIVLFAGANHSNSRPYVDSVLDDFGEGDIIVLQNEINCVDYIIEKACEKKMIICLNLSPFNDDARALDFSKADVLLINEIEGKQLTGQSEPARILDAIREKAPRARVALTLGGEGVIYQDSDAVHRHGVYNVQVVDTTAAGDTFTGYFIAALFSGKDAPEALRLASVAASIAVSRSGASDSIPTISEVLASCLELK